MSARRSIALTRRQWLRACSAGALGGLLAPAWARAEEREAPPRGLVLIELTGGNDALSTVVPYRNDVYQRARPTLRLGARDVLALDEERGLPHALSGLHRLYMNGNLAIVEGVGYPNPARSHFRSLEVWQAGDLRGRAAGSGWVARWRAAALPDDTRADRLVHLGPRTTFALYSADHPPVSLESPTAYQWFGQEQEEIEPFCEAETRGGSEGEGAALIGRDAMLDRLRGVLGSATESSTRIREATRSHQPSVEYPRNRFAAGLRDIAAIVHSGLGTRVLTTNLATFDTHANQASLRANLLRKLDSALVPFLADLASSERGRETLVLCYSEFGRRVAENASGGTDHGKAGVAFVLGQHVRGGLYGKTPDLRRLDDGDAPFTTDFRSVYATLIEDWLGASSRTVLGQDFPRLGFV